MARQDANSASARAGISKFARISPRARKNLGACLSCASCQKTFMHPRKWTQRAPIDPTGRYHTAIRMVYSAAILKGEIEIMRLPPALVPLRNGTFRTLWFASVVVWLGTWLQNTGAGWLMTTLAPRPLIVAMVQAATIMPVFLLALPGGAMADIVDRRVFLIGTQIWTVAAAALLAALTVTHCMTAVWLLILTFAIGIGSAMTAPAWSAIIPELVPREDLVGAITLNGIGFNLTRAIGPALAGFLILLGGSGLTFSLYAASIFTVIGALVMWRRSKRFTGLPPEHLFSAMR